NTVGALEFYPQRLRLRRYFSSALPRLLYMYEQAPLRLTQIHLTFPISFSALNLPLHRVANPLFRQSPVASPSQSGFPVGRGRSFRRHDVHRSEERRVGKECRAGGT